MDRRTFLARAGGFLLTAATAGRARAVGSPPPLPSLRRLNLYNPHTSEHFDGPYRDDHGPIPSAMDELSHFLRDFHSGERIAIDPAMLDFLAAVIGAVGAARATVLSAYRTVATNRALARTTFGVADNSQHLYGRAIDISLASRLEEAMQAARAMKRGGVGWYPRSGFIHLDSGPVRNWTLEGQGLDRLLSPAARLLAQSSASPRLPTTIYWARQPLTVGQRLVLGRVIARVEFLARLSASHKTELLLRLSRGH
jgi:uncharacterized protein YcbK (DUF882 family)